MLKTCVMHTKTVVKIEQILAETFERYWFYFSNGHCQHLYLCALVQGKALFLPYRLRQTVSFKINCIIWVPKVIIVISGLSSRNIFIYPLSIIIYYPLLYIHYPLLSLQPMGRSGKDQLLLLLSLLLMSA